jgi:hypothetical protein
MKRAEFSMLNFTNSFKVNYFCQIADVVPCYVDGLIVIVFSPATSPAPEI